jgi:hypothetical protein
MRPGDVVAHRFEIDRFANGGGMADLYHARDRETGRPVAVKVIRSHRASDQKRFVREARILADLEHPGIVRYVAHGAQRNGELFLAIEWLDGEDLGSRLTRAPLSLEETMVLAVHVAKALTVAHGRGIVHRDVKPGNLFLVDWKIELVKVLDFGLAWADDAETLTRGRRRVGTLGYIAPEQVTGQKPIDARADIFSLGCVLYECVTGRSPFASEITASTLMKVVYEQPPPLRALRPEAPRELESLVARMLSKDRAERPADGAALLADLTSIAEGTPRRPHSEHPSALTDDERRAVCFVMAGTKREQPLPEAGVDVEVLRSAKALRAAAEYHGGRVELVIGGLAVVTLVGSGPATDLAARAVRCAMAIRSILRNAALAIATGNGDLSARLPPGDVLEIAGRLLNLSESDRERPGGDPSAIRLDEATASLLGRRFDVGSDERGLLLRGESEIADKERTLLHRSTPFVGRDREMATLLLAVDECVKESVARLVVVSAPPGFGKTRLRQELVRQLVERAFPLDVWTGGGYPTDKRAPFSTLSRVLRSAARIAENEPQPARQQKLRARVSQHVSPDDVPRVTDFLGELMATPFHDFGNPPLRAARQDAMLMRLQTRRAWEDFVAAECAAHPVVLLLDDMQWGDPATMQLVEGALRRFKRLPLLVLALGREDVHEVVPKGLASQELRLGGLATAASEELVRAVLGERIRADTVAALVERAGGNPFFLEEIIRSHAAGRADIPESVLAMVKARLHELAPEARRVLRAASIYGMRFSDAGVLALLGGDEQTFDVQRWLDTLVDAELIEPRHPFHRGDFVFCHAFVREAARAMLTVSDRVLGHKLAGAWLEREGGQDPAVIANHFEHGGEMTRAIEWYLCAAESLLKANDLLAAVAHAERGIVCGARGEMLGALRLVQLEARLWHTQPADVERYGRAILTLLEAGSVRWCRAVGFLAAEAAQLADFDGLWGVSGALLNVEPAPAARGVYAMAAASVVLGLSRFGAHEAVVPFLERIERRDGGAEDSWTRGWASLARAVHASYALADPWAHRLFTERALEGFRRSDDPRMIAHVMAEHGEASLALGQFAEAEASMRELGADPLLAPLPTVAILSRRILALALAHRGAFAEARAAAEAALGAVAGHRLHEALACLALARTHVIEGDLASAERVAWRVRSVAPRAAPLQAEALAILATVLLGTGRLAEGLLAARDAIELLRMHGGVGPVESLVRLAFAEGHWANGAVNDARAVLSIARQRLLERAARIGDDAARRSFLGVVPENARTLALAGEWGLYAVAG